MPKQFDKQRTETIYRLNNQTGRLLSGRASWSKIQYLLKWNEKCLFSPPGGNVPNILHQVTVPIIDNEKCQKMFIKSGHKKKVRDSFLCAGYDLGLKDSCEVKPFFLSSPN
jgi:hypothetical protein